MKTFLEFLLEMSLDDAMDVFGITEIPSTKAELNKQFKQLALKNHPDLGGSEEKMKLINQAKDVLDKNVGRTYYSTTKKNTKTKTSVDKEKIKRDYEYVHNLILDTFNKIDTRVYLSYLEKIFNTKFNVKTDITPKDNDKSPFRTGITKLTVEFSDAEKDKVFVLYFMADEYAVFNQIFVKKGLSSATDTFDIILRSFVYVDGKKQVLTKERYIDVHDAKIFTDPSILLPKTKLTKMANGELRKNSKVAKRDFEAMLKTKFDTIISSGATTWYYIPVNDYVVVMYRTVFSIGRDKTVFYLLSKIGKKPTSAFRRYDEFMKDTDIRQKYPSKNLLYVLENKEGFDFLLSSLTNLKKTNNLDKFMKDFVKYSESLLN